MTDSRNPFPLPLVWRTPLDWFFLAPYAGHLVDHRIVARCGGSLVVLDAADGTLIRRVPLGPGAATGAFFVRHDGSFITDVVREPERRASLVAVTAEGERRWRLDTRASVAPHGALLLDGSLFLLAPEPGAGRMLYRIDPADGALLSTRKLRWGGDEAVPVGGDLLVRSQTAHAGQPGLYRMSRTGDGEVPLLEESVWLLERDAARILTLSRGSVEEPRSLRAWDAEALTESWSVATVTEVAALGEEEVVHIAEGGAHGTPVSLEAGSCRERWRGRPLPFAASGIHLAGPLVIVRHMLGAVYYRRSDGAHLGDVTGHHGPPTMLGRSIVVFGERSAACLSLEGV